VNPIAGLLGVEAEPVFTDPRPGDVRQSCADITAARVALGFSPEIGFREGMARTVDWFRERSQ
jgi:nucleoside-diphosphate-sugar epimerase